MNYFILLGKGELLNLFVLRKGELLNLFVGQSQLPENKIKSPEHVVYLSHVLTPSKMSPLPKFTPLASWNFSMII